MIHKSGLSLIALILLAGCWSKPAIARDDSIGNIDGIYIRVPKEWVLGRVLYEGENAVDPPLSTAPSFRRPISSIGYEIRLDTRSVIHSRAEDIEFKLGPTYAKRGTADLTVSAGVTPYKDLNGGRLSLVDQIKLVSRGKYVAQPDLYGLSHLALKHSDRGKRPLYNDIYISSDDQITIGCTPRERISASVTQQPACFMEFLDESRKILTTIYLAEYQVHDWRVLHEIAADFLNSIVTASNGGSNGNQADR